MVSRAQQMSTDPKQVLDDAVNGREALQLDGRLEAAHLALPLAGQLVRDLSAVVRVLVGNVNYGRHHRPTGRRVTAQLVRKQPARLSTLPLQQLTEESDRRPPISSGLDQ